MKIFKNIIPLSRCRATRSSISSSHRHLKACAYLEFLEYSERQTKTSSGAKPRNILPVIPKTFAFPNGPPERDPIEVYKVYSRKRPEAPNISKAPFYLGLNYTKKSGSQKCWYKIIHIQTLNDNDIPPSHI